jgi:hypothetical protein
MSECFDSAVSVTQTILDPRTDTKHIIDFQYETKKRFPDQMPSPRVRALKPGEPLPDGFVGNVYTIKPKPIPSPKNYTEQVDELADAILKAAGLSFVKDVG